MTPEPGPDEQRERRERSLSRGVTALIWMGTILVYVAVKAWLDHGGRP